MRNAFERGLAAMLKKYKAEFEYETLKVPYTISHTYYPDFILGNGVIIEAKGRFQKGDAAKMRAVKYQHPELDIRFVFYDAQAKIPGQKTTYAQWADRHGFPWADAVIPEDWTK